MFARVEVSKSQIDIKFSTWDKFLNASRKDLVIPISNIASIDTGSDILKECKGMRAPGTYTFSQTYGFGVIAGTYRQRHGVKHFWNVRAKLAEHTIRFNLTGHNYKSAVVQVQDPQEVINLINL
jgi:hypothetical protein